MAFATATLLGAVGGTPSIAHENATGIVAERMKAMEAVGDAMKDLTALFRGQVSYDPEAVRRAAVTIAAHGADNLTRLFPEGSLDRPTEALPVIWQDWDRFETLAGELSVAAEVLAAAAGNPRPETGGLVRGPGMNGGGMGMMAGKSPMMGGHGGAPAMSPEALAEMPPDASFTHLSQVCNACHTRFRQEQE